jgi:hypothetical protein
LYLGGSVQICSVPLRIDSKEWARQEEPSTDTAASKPKKGEAKRPPKPDPNAGLFG